MKNLFLQHKLKKIQRNKIDRNNISFDKAQKIGVLFESSEQYKSAGKWMEEMIGKGKTIQALVQLKKIPEGETKVPYFTEKEVGFFGNIKNGRLLNFSMEKFDFLFYFGENANAVLEYVMMKNPARCRVGLYREGNEHLFDVMFSVNNKIPFAEKISSVIKKVEAIKVNA